MENSMIQNLEEKTGKTMEDWMGIVKASQLDKHKAIINLLKSDYGLTYGYANLIAHKFLKSDAGSADSQDDLITGQYSKGKEGLKPFYDKLVDLIGAFGGDIEFAPKRAYVSVRRKKQFAIIQPSTKTRLDLGLNIKGKEPDGRLEASGSFNAMCSHRIRITEAGHIDDQVISWVKEAYDNAG